MPRKRLTRAEKQAQTRSEVLDAAARVFPERGYHATSVEGVARRAGLSIGAVYSNFANKAELFLAAYELEVAAWSEDLDAHVRAANTPEARIRAAGDWWSRLMDEQQAWLLAEIEFSAHAVRDQELRERFAAAAAPMQHTTIGLLAATVEEFGVTLPAPPAELGVTVTALARGLMVERLLDPGAIGDDAFAELLARLLITGD